MRYGVQLFGVNPLFRKDPGAFLSRLRQAGYRFLEPCLAFEPVPNIQDRVWTPDDLDKYLPQLQKHGFTVESCHVFTRDLETDLPRLLQIAGQHGIRQYVLPCPLYTNDVVFRSMAQTVSRCADTLKKRVSPC